MCYNFCIWSPINAIQAAMIMPIIVSFKCVFGSLISAINSGEIKTFYNVIYILVFLIFHFPSYLIFWKGCITLYSKCICRLFNVFWRWKHDCLKIHGYRDNDIRYLLDDKWFLSINNGLYVWIVQKETWKMVNEVLQALFSKWKIC